MKYSGALPCSAIPQSTQCLTISTRRITQDEIEHQASEIIALRAVENERGTDRQTGRTNYGHLVYVRIDIFRHVNVSINNMLYLTRASIELNLNRRQLY